VIVLRVRRRQLALPVMALYTPQRLTIPLSDLSQATSKPSARFRSFPVHGAVTPAQASASYGIRESLRPQNALADTNANCVCTASLPPVKQLSKADIDRHFRGLRTGQAQDGPGVVMGRSGAIQPLKPGEADSSVQLQNPPSPDETLQDSSEPMHTSAPGGSSTVHASQRRSTSPARQGGRPGGSGHAPNIPVFSDTERQRFDLLLQRLRCVPPGGALEEAAITREYFGDDFLSIPVHKVHAETGLTVLALAMHYQLHGIIQSALAHPGIATTINLPMPGLPGAPPDSEVPLPPLLLAILHRVPFLTRQLLAAGASPHVRHPITQDTALHLACMGFPQPDVKRKKVARRRKKRTKEIAELPMDEPASGTPVMRIPSTSATAHASDQEEGKEVDGGSNSSSNPPAEGKHADEDNDELDPSLLAVTPPHKVIEALLYAVSSRRPQARRAYLNRSNAEGMTALHTALDLAFATGCITPDGVAVPGDISNAAALLAAGASTLVRDPRSGMTAWQRIVALGSISLAATTLEHGGAPTLSEQVLRRQLQQWWCKGTLVMHGGGHTGARQSKEADEDSKEQDAASDERNTVPESIVSELVRLNRAGQVDTLRWHLVAWRHAKEQQALHAAGITRVSLGGFGSATVRTNGGSAYNGGSGAATLSPSRISGRRARSRSRSPRARGVKGGAHSARSTPLIPPTADELSSMQTLDLSETADLGGLHDSQGGPIRASTLELSSTSLSARGAAGQAHQRSAPGERPSTVHAAQRRSPGRQGVSSRGGAQKSLASTRSGARGGASSHQGFRDKKSMTVQLRPAQEKAMCLMLPSMSKGGSTKGKGGKKGGRGGTAIGAGGIAERILTSSRSRKSHSTLGHSSSRAASAHTASGAGGVGAPSQGSSPALGAEEYVEQKRDEHSPATEAAASPFAAEMPDFDEPPPPAAGFEGGSYEGKIQEDTPAASSEEDYDNEWGE